MNYTTEHIARALRSAREARGFSQRELGAKTGVAQGYISRIENGAVDLRVSSLVALARALGLELTLVPRAVLPAVESITRARAAAPPRGQEGSRPLYGLDEEGDD